MGAHHTGINTPTFSVWELIERSPLIGWKLIPLAFSLKVTFQTGVQLESLNFVLVFKRLDGTLMDPTQNNYDKLSIVFDNLSLKILSQLMEIIYECWKFELSFKDLVPMGFQASFG
jgi:hypothetical protein